jgi:hypothetical protein
LRAVRSHTLSVSRTTGEAFRPSIHDVICAQEQ